MILSSFNVTKHQNARDLKALPSMVARAGQIALGGVERKHQKMESETNSIAQLDASVVLSTA